MLENNYGNKWKQIPGEVTITTDEQQHYPRRQFVSNPSESSYPAGLRYLVVFVCFALSTTSF